MTVNICSWFMTVNILYLMFCDNVMGKDDFFFGQPIKWHWLHIYLATLCEVSLCQEIFGHPHPQGHCHVLVRQSYTDKSFQLARKWRPDKVGKCIMLSSDKGCDKTRAKGCWGKASEEIFKHRSACSEGGPCEHLGRVLGWGCNGHVMGVNVWCGLLCVLWVTCLIMEEPKS